nr:hypothetical protein [uncultured Deefgea sp.]
MKSTLLLLITLPCMSYAALSDENLLVALPTGYKLDFQNKQGNIATTEMVPQAETVSNWTEMVTTQVFLGTKINNVTLAQFQTYMGKTWLAACKDGNVTPLKNGKENGYDFSFWVQTCPLNSATGKPENTWFKAIKGNDSLYIVQKAFKFDPTKEQVAQWTQYLRSAIVCDTRLAESPCPTSK